MTSPSSDSRFPLEGRRVLVAGASRGIGRATARRLAGDGARLTLVSRSREALEELAGELDGARVVPADLGDADSTEEAAGTVLEDGAPDILVNAAGVFDLAPVDRTPLEVLDRNLEVNLRGAFLLIRFLLGPMKDRGTGRVVSVGSVAGRKAFPGNGAYSASKYGLRGLHEVLLEELRGTGVVATLVEPGAVDTAIWDPMEPDRRDDLPSRSDMLRPGDVADAIHFVCTRPHGVAIPFLPVEPA